MQISIPADGCTIASECSQDIAWPNIPTFCEERHWYALYTCANHERRVAAQLAERTIKNYLPVYESVRRWADRQRRLTLPLFPGYVFVYIALPERLRVLQIPGVVRFVGFQGHPTPLSDAEIETVRSCVEHKLHAQPHPHLQVGRRVKIIHGVLAGGEGILLRKKGLFRVVLSLPLIQRSVAIEVNSSDVDPVGDSGSAVLAGRSV